MFFQISHHAQDFTPSVELRFVRTGFFIFVYILDDRKSFSRYVPFSQCNILKLLCILFQSILFQSLWKSLCKPRSDREVPNKVYFKVLKLFAFILYYMFYKCHIACISNVQFQRSKQGMTTSFVNHFTLCILHHHTSANVYVHHSCFFYFFLCTFNRFSH
jgi:hypothetical protein